MPRDPYALVAQMGAALRDFDYVTATTLVDELIGDLKPTTHAAKVFPLQQAFRLLQLLRRKRRFDDMRRLAAAFIRHGQGSHAVRRQHAQALIDLGRLDHAEKALRELVGEASGAERFEAYGLLGRVNKQRYVNDPRGPRSKSALRRAIDYYRGSYERDRENHWHGINVVALVERAKRDKVKVDAPPDALVIARQILERVEQLEQTQTGNAFMYATAAEACIALGQSEYALLWADEYVHSSSADAFELASTYRQLREVWQLEYIAPDLACVLYPLLQGQQLKRESGRIEGEHQLLSSLVGRDSTGLEKKLSPQSLRTIAWLKNALRRSEIVARIETPAGRAVGTGFLVAARDLSHARWAGDDRFFLLTNAHVIGQTVSPGTLDAQAARIQFTLFPRGAETDYRVDKIEWFSPRDALDVTICSLRGDLPTNVHRLDFGSCGSLTWQPPPPVSRIYIAGYPGGRNLEFSLYDNELHDLNANYLRYRSSTEKGSSGSPVFDDEWCLIGIHHSHDENARANCGSRIDRIQAELR